MTLPFMPVKCCKQICPRLTTCLMPEKRLSIVTTGVYVRTQGDQRNIESIILSDPKVCSWRWHWQQINRQSSYIPCLHTRPCGKTKYLACCSWFQTDVFHLLVTKIALQQLLCPCQPLCIYLHLSAGCHQRQSSRHSSVVSSPSVACLGQEGYVHAAQMTAVKTSLTLICLALWQLTFLETDCWRRWKLLHSPASDQAHLWYQSRCQTVSTTYTEDHDHNTGSNKHGLIHQHIMETTFTADLLLMENTSQLITWLMLNN